MAQVVPLVGSLAIARIFVPAEFGTFMAWLGATSLAAVFSTARFEMALALEPDGLPRAKAAAATALTTVLVIGVLAIFGLLFAVVFPIYRERFGNGLVGLFIPTVGASAGAQIWQAWAAAEGRFRALSGMRIVQACAVTGLQLLGGLLYPSAVTLALAQFLGVMAGVAFIARYLPLPSLTVDRAELQKFWSRYRRFPIYALPADTVNTAASQLPLAILATRFGPDVAGFVALAFRTLGAPISLMGSAVLDVFKRRASESWRLTGSCRGTYIETFMVLAAGSALATLVFWLMGEQLFTIAFGEKWRPAGAAAVILLPLFALRFVASPLSYTLYIAEKQNLDLIWQICLFAVTLATLVLFPGYEATLSAYALGYGILYVIYLGLTYWLSGGHQADTGV
ncbi:O-antigen/teichoic acid export membrane protein [Rhizobium aquaticum]|uniref:O-antigen/teichoic acid export membrane protein n=1 Tax=Rhizobium aquaticum TaxID=1549636 RepID=A0ABV2J511_9HYPH